MTKIYKYCGESDGFVEVLDKSTIIKGDIVNVNHELCVINNVWVDEYGQFCFTHVKWRG